VQNNLEKPLLSVQGMNLSVPYRGERLTAVRNLSFSLPVGGTLGIVGESGSGKTLTALAVAGLSSPQIRMESGTIVYDGREMTTLDPDSIRSLRGSEISMVFQDSQGALNPLMRNIDQVTEGLLLFEHMKPVDAQKRAEELFAQVELPSGALYKYPHQLSGGQRQRVMIAIALARKPRLLIADEPTTALDVTTRIQLQQLLRRLQSESGMALLLISHDITVIEYLCQQVIVLYAGEVMESGLTAAITKQPAHPYTKGLLGATPSYTKRGNPLQTVQGVAESLQNRPWQGCAFAPRCPQAKDMCRKSSPPLVKQPNRDVRCYAAQHDAGNCVPL